MEMAITASAGPLLMMDVHWLLQLPTLRPFNSCEQLLPTHCQRLQAGHKDSSLVYLNGNCRDHFKTIYALGFPVDTP